MTRKDTILIAVVINAGLLAVLFTTAIIYDTDKGNDQLDIATTLVENQLSTDEKNAPSVIAALTGDEVDNVLKYYNAPHSQSDLISPSVEIEVQQPAPSAPSRLNRGSNAEAISSSERIPTPSNAQERVIEVTVKRGDVLEKIARANKTTVEAIQRANHLEGERLAIGQVLKIPVKSNSSSGAVAIATTESTPPPSIKQQPEIRNEPQLNEPVYYTVKSGDNPWKIAKLYGVKYDEILRLNHLDEEKARNLKIGDRIRVK